MVKASGATYEFINKSIIEPLRMLYLFSLKYYKYE